MSIAPLRILKGRKERQIRNDAGKKVENYKDRV